MIIAGLDVASRSGICILEDGRLLHASSHRPPGDTDAAIAHGFRLWLRPLLLSHRVEALAIEAPLSTAGFGAKVEVTDDEHLFGGSRKKVRYQGPQINQATIRRLYGLYLHAEEIAYGLSIPVHSVNVKTWRSAFLPGGNRVPAGTKNPSDYLKKEAVRVCGQLGWPITAPDAADAAGVAFWLAGQLRINQRQGEMAL